MTLLMTTGIPMTAMMIVMAKMSACLEREREIHPPPTHPATITPDPSASGNALLTGSLMHPLTLTLKFSEHCTLIMMYKMTERK